MTPVVAKRQQTASPSNIPAYASPCSGAVKYSSACSCLGVTVRTTTIAAPRQTVTRSETTTTGTTTATQVATSTLAAAPVSPDRFLLKVRGGSRNGETVRARFASGPLPPGRSIAAVDFVMPGEVGAVTFRLVDGLLRTAPDYPDHVGYGGTFIWASPSTGRSHLGLASRDRLEELNYKVVACELSPTNRLICGSNLTPAGPWTFTMCSDSLYIEFGPAGQEMFCDFPEEEVTVELEAVSPAL